LSQNSDLQDRIDFAKFAIEHTQNLITMTDTKASISIGIDGVMLAIIFASSSSQSFLSYPRFIPVLFSFLFLSAIFGFATIFPRSVKSPPTRLYYKSILTKSRKDFQAEFVDVAKRDLLEDCVNNIYTLAEIQRRKSTPLNLSILLLVGGMIAIVAFEVFRIYL
jgi:hypothetical protein